MGRKTGVRTFKSRSRPPRRMVNRDSLPIFVVHPPRDLPMDWAGHRSGRHRPSQGHTVSERFKAVLSYKQLKAYRAVERCRTAALGGHNDKCEDCTNEPSTRVDHAVAQNVRRRAWSKPVAPAASFSPPTLP